MLGQVSVEVSDGADRSRLFDGDGARIGGGVLIRGAAVQGVIDPRIRIGGG